jgi:hypothetical protein
MWPTQREEPPLPERITAASRELKLARKDGSAEWIAKAAKALDDLLDQLPCIPTTGVQ